MYMQHWQFVCHKPTSMLPTRWFTKTRLIKNVFILIMVFFYISLLFALISADVRHSVLFIYISGLLYFFVQLLFHENTPMVCCTSITQNSKCWLFQLMMFGSVFETLIINCFVFILYILSKCFTIGKKFEFIYFYINIIQYTHIKFYIYFTQPPRF